MTDPLHDIPEVDDEFESDLKDGFGPLTLIGQVFESEDELEKAKKARLKYLKGAGYDPEISEKLRAVNISMLRYTGYGFTPEGLKNIESIERNSEGEIFITPTRDLGPGFSQSNKAVGLKLSIVQDSNGQFHQTLNAFHWMQRMPGALGNDGWTTRLFRDIGNTIRLVDMMRNLGNTSIDMSGKDKAQQKNLYIAARIVGLEIDGLKTRSIDPKNPHRIVVEAGSAFFPEPEWDAEVEKVREQLRANGQLDKDGLLKRPQPYTSDQMPKTAAGLESPEAFNAPAGLESLDHDATGPAGLEDIPNIKTPQEALYDKIGAEIERLESDKNALGGETDEHLGQKINNLRDALDMMHETDAAGQKNLNIITDDEVKGINEYLDKGNYRAVRDAVSDIMATRDEDLAFTPPSLAPKTSQPGPQPGLEALPKFEPRAPRE